MSLKSSHTPLGRPARSARKDAAILLLEHRCRKLCWGTRGPFYGSTSEPTISATLLWPHCRRYWAIPS
jgi:hypothetical protein